MAPVIVVESAGKQRILLDLVRKCSLDGWTVVSCSGHYCGLPKTQLGIDPKTLEFTWKVRNMQAFERVKKAVADADLVYAATDLSPEGEAIANQVGITAGYAKKPFHRLRLAALDAAALKTAIESPDSLDPKILQGYLAREASDRLVHFTLSPILAQRLGEGLQLHRVALPALSELARVERKIRKFRPEIHHIVRVLLSDGSTAESGPMAEDRASDVVRRAKAATPAYSSAREVEAAQPPFTLSTLIQFASRRYGIDALTCVKTCETLFSMGLITYPYTDSCALPDDAAKTVHSYVHEKLPGSFLEKAPVSFSSISTLEAIRPVQISAIPSQLDLSNDLRSLYSAIWFRTTGSQGRACLLERQLMTFSLDDEEVFRAVGLKIIESNWHQLSGRLFEPVVRVLEPDAVVEEASAFATPTKPPVRHTHGTLVAWLDAHFLGRPWTYRSVLEFLQENAYVDSLGGGLLRITPKGETVLTFIRRASKDLIDPDFCVDIEQQIGLVEQGRLNFEQFYRHQLERAAIHSEALSKKSLRPEFTSPEGQKLKVFVDKESGRPYVRASGEDWWSYVAFDEKGKIVVTTEGV